VQSALPDVSGLVTRSASHLSGLLLTIVQGDGGSLAGSGGDQRPVRLRTRTLAGMKPDMFDSPGEQFGVRAGANERRSILDSSFRYLHSSPSKGDPNAAPILAQEFAVMSDLHTAPFLQTPILTAPNTIVLSGTRRRAGRLCVPAPDFARLVEDQTPRSRVGPHLDATGSSESVAASTPVKSLIPRRRH